VPLPNLPAAHRGLVTVLAVTTLSALAAACGGGSSAAAKATTTAPTTTTSTVANRAAFRQCMASHGITIAAQPPRTTVPAGSATTTSRPPGGGGGGAGAGRFLQPPPGVDPAKYQVALSACRSLLPTGGGAGNGQFRTAYIAYVTCLRNHGVTTGDPTLAQQALSNVDRNSPAFLAAAKACLALLPQRSGDSGSSTTTSVAGA
jgi:hypothetical protein